MSLRIARVEKAKRGEKYIVCFDGALGIEVTEATVVKFSLLPGRVLEDEELEAVAAEQKKQSARAKAAALVGIRPLTEKELLRRLLEKEIPEEDARDAVSWLVEMGAVNDAEYAASLVRRCGEKGWGRAKIKDEFYKRGVPRELWDEALSGFSANEESIDKLLRTKLRNGADRKEMKKATDALFRRGFSWDEIREAVARYREACPEDAENEEF